MILSCHQPNFLPWLPFFEKIAASDVFVILGGVQYTRHQFQNRFQYNNSWYTMSVNTGNLSDLIVDKKYVSHERDWSRIKNRLKNFDLTFLDKFISPNLFETNSSIILEIIKRKEISTSCFIETHRGDANPTQMIINLCEKYGATTYLAGPSGRKYLDFSMFQNHKIELSFFSATNSTTLIDSMEINENR